MMPYGEREGQRRVFVRVENRGTKKVQTDARADEIRLRLGFPGRLYHTRAKAVMSFSINGFVKLTF